MAIPPIISNNPLLKLFRTDDPGFRRESGGKTEKTSNAASTPQDIVEISQAAQQRLSGIQQLSADNPEQIQDVAGETKEILEETDVALGRN